MNSSNKILIPSIVVLLLLVAAFVGYAYFGKSDVATTTDTTPIDTTTDTAPVADTTGTPSDPTATPVASTSTYKDGTYSATGTYHTPESTEHVAVTLTLANDIVTDANVTINAAIPESRQYQARFLSNYKAQVIGKSIESLHLSEVSGSSLTSGGFNDAVTQIEAQAKS